ncbi:hypothetical protein [Streptomyces sp. NBC_01233]|uniref:hypothetical protein n=1 Tax=Streptomyces sp. NBC_01233 TaxID=2903787 RepID=UPI002E0E77F4|nr:hypothetical protein OG332_18665 [Streptomyces sp. NBC_01233]
MNKNLFRASAVAAAAVAFSGIISVSQSASAAQTCTTTGNSRIQSMPGAIPEAQLNAPTCVEALPDNKVRGKATVNWGFINDGQSDLTSKRFTSFKVTTRLESRVPGGTDVVVNSKTCDLTANINAAPEGAFACLTPAVTLDPGKQWSGDATVVYDIEGDAKGPITWQLVGSPLMS